MGRTYGLLMDKLQEVRIKKLKEKISQEVSKVIDIEFQDFKADEYREWQDKENEYIKELKLLHQNLEQTDRKRADYLNQAVENNKKANRVRVRYNELKKRYDAGVKYLEKVNTINAIKLLIIAVKQIEFPRIPRFLKFWSKSS